MQSLSFEVHLSYRLERVEQYLHIEQEPKATQRGTPPAYWPASGSLSVKNLNARYSETGPNILHDVSFDIQSGERIGVGESSALRLCLSSLLR
jgi:ABC-type bacteriocin/lantibiotic exporter with double-glycine peptidase domain